MGFSRYLEPDQVYDMSKTILYVAATLSGLSAIATGIFLSAMKPKNSERFLRSKILGLIAVSFFCFWFTLLAGFYSLVDSTNVNALMISIGSTVSGSIVGSLYLVYYFRDFLLSETRS